MLYHKELIKVLKRSIDIIEAETFDDWIIVDFYFKNDSSLLDPSGDAHAGPKVFGENTNAYRLFLSRCR